MVYLHMRREYVVHRSDVEAIILMLKYLASMFSQDTEDVV